jgi:hypothetical protein
VAKETLSTAEPVQLTAHLPGGPVAVSLTRAELDRAVHPCRCPKNQRTVADLLLRQP